MDFQMQHETGGRQYLMSAVISDVWGVPFFRRHHWNQKNPAGIFLCSNYCFEINMWFIFTWKGLEVDPNQGIWQEIME